MKRFLSVAFLLTVWVFGMSAYAAGTDTAMKKATKLHDGVNTISDRDVTYLVTVKNNKLVSVKAKAAPGAHGLVADKAIKVVTTKKPGSKGLNGKYGCYYEYYCWYDYYGNYLCSYEYVCG